MHANTIGGNVVVIKGRWVVLVDSHDVNEKGRNKSERNGNALQFIVGGNKSAESTFYIQTPRGFGA